MVNWNFHNYILWKNIYTKRSIKIRTLIYAVYHKKILYMLLWVRVTYTIKFWNRICIVKSECPCVATREKKYQMFIKSSDQNDTYLFMLHKILKLQFILRWVLHLQYKLMLTIIWYCSLNPISNLKYFLIYFLQ